MKKFLIRHEVASSIIISILMAGVFIFILYLVGCASLSREYTCLDRAIELCQKYEAEGYQTEIGIGYSDDYVSIWTKHNVIEYWKDGEPRKRYSFGHNIPTILEWISWQEAERRWR